MDTENFAGIQWESPLVWRYICKSQDVPLTPDTGSAAVFLAGDTQIAIFRFPDNRLFASQNMCGHRRAFILSEGILGTDKSGHAFVACPIHRRKFALEGEHTGYTRSNNFAHSIATFEAKEENDEIFLKLPHIQELDAVLGTKKWSASNRPRPAFLESIGSRRSGAQLLDGPQLLDGEGSPRCESIDSNLTW